MITKKIKSIYKKFLKTYKPKPFKEVLTKGGFYAKNDIVKSQGKKI